MAKLSERELRDVIKLLEAGKQQNPTVVETIKNMNNVLGVCIEELIE